MKKEIGFVTVAYNEIGKVTMSRFEPTIKVELTETQLGQLTILKGSDDQKTMEENAQFVFASWFNSMNEIELADRDQYEIVTETIRCDRYPSGSIKTCVMRVVFQ